MDEAPNRCKCIQAAEHCRAVGTVPADCTRSIGYTQ